MLATGFLTSKSITNQPKNDYLRALDKNLSSTQLNELINSSSIFNLSNSLLILKNRKDQSSQNDGGENSLAVENIPFCLFPSPFTKESFLKAQRIQKIYNKLYVYISSRSDLIDLVIGKMVSDGNQDKFTGRLYEVWRMVQDEKRFKKDVGGAIGLGIFRSDYLLHCSDPDSNITEGRKGINGPGLEIKQVEFNTVSVSFAALATKVSGLHRFLTGLTSKYTVDQLPRPPNCATRNLCKGLEISHRAYRSTYSPEMPTVILMIVQPGERNVFDQTLLIYELDEMSSGPSDRNRMIRLPCDRILDQTRLDEDSMRLYYLIDGADRFEVSVIYYRSMYGPEDFMTEDRWLARYRLERSRSVKCPSLSVQLAGCKKFQQVLTDQNFVRDHLYLDRSGVMNEDEFEEIKSTWVDILDFDGGRSSLAYQLGTNHKSYTSYVLKPQREGGGNNVYGADIPARLNSLSDHDLKSYILMSLIRTPKGMKNYLIRPRDVGQRTPEPSEVISELGIYGVCVYRTNCVEGGVKLPALGGLEIIENLEAGHVVRTKDSGSDEGGVAIGISCLDSPLLL
ncbi:glutathione synthetase [Phakopsora pachyrhizi]|uniref:Glutathione synthetase n=1 Tax=Phakopsora pachyrhizi TaxID=170000 RepID=A0AAV0B8K0_PHAPC|nr:glutathione synthetase [Phakopsora pachyrhizi]